MELIWWVTTGITIKLNRTDIGYGVSFGADENSFLFKKLYFYRFLFILIVDTVTEVPISRLPPAPPPPPGHPPMLSASAGDACMLIGCSLPFFRPVP